MLGSWGDCRHCSCCASCTAAALQAAATGGGTIVFNCGAAPVTITVTSPIMFTKETILDGGATVTLSGGGTSRILYLDSNYNAISETQVGRCMYAADYSARSTNPSRESFPKRILEVEVVANPSTGPTSIGAKIIGW